MAYHRWLKRIAALVSFAILVPGRVAKPRADDAIVLRMNDNSGMARARAVFNEAMLCPDGLCLEEWITSYRKSSEHFLPYGFSRHRSSSSPAIWNPEFAAGKPA